MMKEWTMMALHFQRQQRRLERKIDVDDDVPTALPDAPALVAPPWPEDWPPPAMTAQ
jgi:hypothetical protein